MQRGIRYHFFFSGDPNSVFVRSFRRRVEVNGAYEAAGKLSGEGRREGSSEDTGRVSGRFEGIRHAVLYHERYRRKSRVFILCASGRRSKTGWPLCPSQHQGKRKFLLRTSYYGQQVEVDGQGRLLFPGCLRNRRN